jgi:hypothetical protein
LPDDIDFSPRNVALCGQTLVVVNTAANAGVGAAYIFGPAYGTWVLQAKLSPSDLNTGALFPLSVDISGDTVVIGAPGAQSLSTFWGAAYVFVKLNGQWVQTSKLTGPDGVPGNSFGITVSIQGGTIAASAFNEATAAGPGGASIYLLHSSDHQWTPFAQVSGSDVTGSGAFGGALVFRNGTLLVGAPLQHPQPNNVPYPEGEAYIYNVN